ncbi:hypothetical protein ABZW18_00250 [Streptomyces sp. NPDC004647]|uniref:hypothetical protein n=1 Tax=Streptomyces sp. NPDC004647 TaxID=3154671 RepID=UPI0033A6413E
MRGLDTPTGRRWAVIATDDGGVTWIKQDDRVIECLFAVKDEAKRTRDALILAPELRATAPGSSGQGGLATLQTHRPEPSAAGYGSPGEALAPTLGEVIAKEVRGTDQLVKVRLDADDTTPSITILTCWNPVGGAQVGVGQSVFVSGTLGAARPFNGRMETPVEGGTVEAQALVFDRRNLSVAAPHGWISADRIVLPAIEVGQQVRIPDPHHPRLRSSTGANDQATAQPVPFSTVTVTSVSGSSMGGTTPDGRTLTFTPSLVAAVPSGSTDLTPQAVAREPTQGPAAPDSLDLPEAKVTELRGLRTSDRAELAATLDELQPRDDGTPIQILLRQEREWATVAWCGAYNLRDDRGHYHNLEEVLAWHDGTRLVTLLDRRPHTAAPEPVNAPIPTQPDAPRPPLVPRPLESLLPEELETHAHELDQWIKGHTSAGDTGASVRAVQQRDAIYIELKHRQDRTADAEQLGGWEAFTRDLATLTLEEPGRDGVQGVVRDGIRLGTIIATVAGHTYVHDGEPASSDAPAFHSAEGAAVGLARAPAEQEALEQAAVVVPQPVPAAHTSTRQPSPIAEVTPRFVVPVGEADARQDGDPNYKLKAHLRSVRPDAHHRDQRGQRILSEACHKHGARHAGTHLSNGGRLAIITIAPEKYEVRAPDQLLQVGGPWGKNIRSREQANKIADALESIRDAQGQPFPWDLPDPMQRARCFRDAEGRDFKSAILRALVTHNLDPKGKYAKAYQARMGQRLTGDAQTAATPDGPVERPAPDAEAGSAVPVDGPPSNEVFEVTVFGKTGEIAGADGTFWWRGEVDNPHQADRPRTTLKPLDKPVLVRMRLGKKGKGWVLVEDAATGELVRQIRTTSHFQAAASTHPSQNRTPSSGNAPSGDRNRRFTSVGQVHTHFAAATVPALTPERTRELRAIKAKELVALSDDGQFVVRAKDGQHEVMPSGSGLPFSGLLPDVFLAGSGIEALPEPLKGLPTSEQALEFAGRLASLRASDGSPIDWSDPQLPGLVRGDQYTQLNHAVLGARALFDREHGRSSSLASRLWRLFELQSDRGERLGEDRWADDIPVGDWVWLTIDDQYKLREILSREETGFGTVRLTLDDGGTWQFPRNLPIEHAAADTVLGPDGRPMGVRIASDFVLDEDIIEFDLDRDLNPITPSGQGDQNDAGLTRIRGRAMFTRKHTHGPGERTCLLDATLVTSTGPEPAPTTTAGTAFQLPSHVIRLSSRAPLAQQPPPTQATAPAASPKADAPTTSEKAAGSNGDEAAADTRWDGEGDPPPGDAVPIQSSTGGAPVAGDEETPRPDEITGTQPTGADRPLAKGDEVVTPEGLGTVEAVSTREALVQTHRLHPWPFHQLKRPGSDAPILAPGDRDKAQKNQADLAQASTAEGLELRFTDGKRLKDLNVAAGHGLIVDRDGTTIGWVRARIGDDGERYWWAQDADGGGPDSNAFHENLPVTAGAPAVRAANNVADDRARAMQTVGGKTSPRAPVAPAYAAKEVIFTPAQVRELSQLTVTGTFPSGTPIKGPEWVSNYRKYVLNVAQMQALGVAARAAATETHQSTAQGSRNRKVLLAAAQKLDFEQYDAGRIAASIPPPGEPDPYEKPYAPRSEDTSTPDLGTATNAVKDRHGSQASAPRPKAASGKAKRWVRAEIPASHTTKKRLGLFGRAGGRDCDRCGNEGDLVLLVWHWSGLTERSGITGALCLPCTELETGIPGNQARERAEAIDADRGYSLVLGPRYVDRHGVSVAQTGPKQWTAVHLATGNRYRIAKESESGSRGYVVRDLDGISVGAGVGVVSGYDIAARHAVERTTESHPDIGDRFVAFGYRQKLKAVKAEDFAEGEHASEVERTKDETGAYPSGPLWTLTTGDQPFRVEMVYVEGPKDADGHQLTVSDQSGTAATFVTWGEVLTWARERAGVDMTTVPKPQRYSRARVPGSHGQWSVYRDGREGEFCKVEEDGEGGWIAHGKGVADATGFTWEEACEAYEMGLAVEDLPHPASSGYVRVPQVTRAREVLTAAGYSDRVVTPAEPGFEVTGELPHLGPGSLAVHWSGRAPDEALAAMRADGFTEIRRQAGGFTAVSATVAKVVEDEGKRAKLPAKLDRQAELHGIPRTPAHYWDTPNAKDDAPKVLDLCAGPGVLLDYLAAHYGRREDAPETGTTQPLERDASAEVEIPEITLTPRSYVHKNVPYDWKAACGTRQGYSITHDCQGPGNRGVKFRAFWYTPTHGGRAWTLGIGGSLEEAQEFIRTHWRESQKRDTEQTAAEMNFVSGAWVLPKVGEGETVECVGPSRWNVTVVEGITYELKHPHGEPYTVSLGADWVKHPESFEDCLAAIREHAAAQTPVPAVEELQLELSDQVAAASTIETAENSPQGPFAPEVPYVSSPAAAQEAHEGRPLRSSGAGDQSPSPAVQNENTPAPTPTTDEATPASPAPAEAGGNELETEQPTLASPSDRVDNTPVGEDERPPRKHGGASEPNALRAGPAADPPAGRDLPAADEYTPQQEETMEASAPAANPPAGPGEDAALYAFPREASEAWQRVLDSFDALDRAHKSWPHTSGHSVDLSDLRRHRDVLRRQLPAASRGLVESAHQLEEMTRHLVEVRQDVQRSADTDLQQLLIPAIDNLATAVEATSERTRTTSGQVRGLLHPWDTTLPEATEPVTEPVPAGTPARPGRILHPDGTAVHHIGTDKDAEPRAAITVGAVPAADGAGRWQAIRYADGTYTIAHPALLQPDGQDPYPLGKSKMQPHSWSHRWRTFDRAEAAGHSTALLEAFYLQRGDMVTLEGQKTARQVTRIQRGAQGRDRKRLRAQRTTGIRIHHVGLQGGKERDNFLPGAFDPVATRLPETHPAVTPPPGEEPAPVVAPSVEATPGGDATPAVRTTPPRKAAPSGQDSGLLVDSTSGDREPGEGDPVGDNTLSMGTTQQDGTTQGVAPSPTSVVPETGSTAAADDQGAAPVDERTPASSAPLAPEQATHAQTTAATAPAQGDSGAVPLAAGLDEEAHTPYADRAAFQSAHHALVREALFHEHWKGSASHNDEHLTALSEAMTIVPVDGYALIPDAVKLLPRLAEAAQRVHQKWQSTGAPALSTASLGAFASAAQRHSSRSRSTVAAQLAQEAAQETELAGLHEHYLTANRQNCNLLEVPVPTPTGTMELGAFLTERAEQLEEQLREKGSSRTGHERDPEPTAGRGPHRPLMDRARTLVDAVLEDLEQGPASERILDPQAVIVKGDEHRWLVSFPASADRRQDRALARDLFVRIVEAIRQTNDAELAESTLTVDPEPPRGTTAEPASDPTGTVVPVQPSSAPADARQERRDTGRKDSGPSILERDNRVYTTEADAGERLYQDVQHLMATEDQPAPTVYGQFLGRQLFYAVSQDPEAGPQATTATIYFGWSDSTEQRQPIAYLPGAELPALNGQTLLRELTHWANDPPPVMTALLPPASPTPGTASSHDAAPAPDRPNPAPGSHATPPGAAEPAAPETSAPHKRPPTSAPSTTAETAGTATDATAGLSPVPEQGRGESTVLADGPEADTPTDQPAQNQPADDATASKAAATPDAPQTSQAPVPSITDRLSELARTALIPTGVTPDLSVMANAGQLVITYGSSGDPRLDQEVERQLRTGIHDQIKATHDDELARYRLEFRRTQQVGQTALSDTTAPQPSTPTHPDPETERLHSLLERAATLYTEALHSDSGGQARRYLKNRGQPADGEASRRWQVGYAQRGKQGSVIDKLRQEEFTDHELLRVGLLARNHASGELYNAFYHRLMWPVPDLNGRVAGFTARRMPASSSNSKYINSAGETSLGPTLYSKSRLLLGMEHLNSTTGPIFISEGPFELQALDVAHTSAGLERPALLGTCGTALTAEHMQLLTEQCDTSRPLIIAFNNDDAGRKALLRAWKHLQHWPGQVLALFPQGAQGEDFGAIHQDHERGPREVLRQVQHNQLPGLDAVVEAALQTMATPEERHTRDFQPTDADHAAATVAAGYIRDAAQASSPGDVPWLEHQARHWARRLKKQWNIPVQVTAHQILLGPEEHGHDQENAVYQRSLDALAEDPLLATDPFVRGRDSARFDSEDTPMTTPPPAAGTDANTPDSPASSPGSWPAGTSPTATHQAHPAPSIASAPGADLQFTMTTTGPDGTQLENAERIPAAYRLYTDMRDRIDLHAAEQKTNSLGYGSMHGVPLSTSGDNYTSDNPTLIIWIGRPPRDALRYTHTELQQLGPRHLLAAVEWRTAHAVGRLGEPLSTEWIRALRSILPNSFPGAPTPDALIDLLRTITSNAPDGALETTRTKVSQALERYTAGDTQSALEHLAAPGHIWVLRDDGAWVEETTTQGPDPAWEQVDANLKDQRRELEEVSKDAASQPAGDPTTPAPPVAADLTVAHHAAHEAMAALRPYSIGLPGTVYEKITDLVAPMDGGVRKLQRLRGPDGERLMHRAKTTFVRVLEGFATIASKLRLTGLSERLERVVARLRLQDLAHIERDLERRMAAPGISFDERGALQEEWIINRARWRAQYQHTNGRPAESDFLPDNGLIAGAPPIPNLIDAHNILLARLLRRVAELRDEDPEKGKLGNRYDPKGDLLNGVAWAYQQRLIGFVPTGEDPEGPIPDSVLRKAALTVTSHRNASPLTVRRALGVSAERADRILHRLESHQVLGPYQSNAPRPVIAQPADIDTLLAQPPLAPPRSPHTATPPAAKAPQQAGDAAQPVRSDPESLEYWAAQMAQKLRAGQAERTDAPPPAQSSEAAPPTPDRRREAEDNARTGPTAALTPSRS